MRWPSGMGCGAISWVGTVAVSLWFSVDDSVSLWISVGGSVSVGASVFVGGSTSRALVLSPKVVDSASVAALFSVVSSSSSTVGECSAPSSLAGTLPGSEA